MFGNGRPRRTSLTPVIGRWRGRSANTTASSCAISWSCAAARALRRRITCVPRIEISFIRRRAGSSWACAWRATCNRTFCLVLAEGRAMAKKPNTVPAKAADALTATVLEGLKKEHKELSPVWFYDELGSFLFDNICELPEYYITRTELQIMHGHASDMAHAIGSDAALIEYGSGTSMKTRLLLDRLENPLAYVPVDISREHLFTAAGSLAKDYPNLHIVPVCADFTQHFELPNFIRTASRRVVYFPGSTI